MLALWLPLALLDPLLEDGEELDLDELLEDGVDGSELDELLLDDDDGIDGELLLCELELGEGKLGDELELELDEDGMDGELLDEL